MADRMVFFRTSLILGGAGSLDSIDGVDRGDTNALQDGDMAFTIDSGKLYAHTLDADSGLAESSPGVIKPDTNAGDMRWIQQTIDLGIDISDYLLIADIDDTPVDTATTVPISSNWAYDHTANAAAHHAVYTHPNHSGDVTSSGDGATTIATKAVHVSMLADGTDGELITWGTDGVATVIAAGDDSHVLTSHGAGAVPTWEAAGAAFDPAAPGTIGGTTPGVIYGLNKEIYKTADADSPLTSLQCSGTIVSNYGMTDADCTIELPAAAEGLSFVAILPAVQAHFFKFHAGASDKIYLLGVAGSDNGNVGVASGYATGASASFFTFKASDGNYDWFCIPIFGTWTAS